jgi:hypothetical protein
MALGTSAVNRKLTSVFRKTRCHATVSLIAHCNPPAFRIADAVFAYSLNNAFKCFDFIADAANDHNSLLLDQGPLAPNQVFRIAQVKFTHRLSLARLGQSAQKIRNF